MSRQIKRVARVIEDLAAEIASPFVFAFSNAPPVILNAITALMPALVVLLVFHSGIICTNIIRATFNF